MGGLVTMTDERSTTDLSDLTREHPRATPPRKTWQHQLWQHLLLPAAVGGALAVYYGWFVPEQNLLTDYQFCMQSEIREYRRIVLGYRGANISNLQAPETSLTCAEIYQRVPVEVSDNRDKRDE